MIFAQRLEVNADVVVEVKHPFDMNSNKTPGKALDHKGLETCISQRDSVDPDVQNGFV